VLANPVIQPIVFAGASGTPNQTDIGTFTSTLGAQSYWSAAVGEYGVGNITGKTPVVVSTPPASGTIQDSDVQTFIQNEFTAGALGTPNTNTIYAVYYPSTTNIQLGQGVTCQTIGGYHSEMSVTGTGGAATEISYAVLPACSNFDNLTEIQMQTGASSHEFAEASTDPNPQTNPAYDTVDADHLAWFFLGGAEDGDMCAQNPGAFFQPSGFAYTVQRTWSNKSAAASHDPCAPAPSDPYFNSAPVLTDSITFQGFTTKGAQIPVGQSKTVEIDLFSDAPTSPWSVSALDFNSLSSQGGTPSLSFSFDNTSGQNGDKIHMTITVENAGQFGNVQPFIIVSKQGTTKAALWMGLAGQ
jgi:hypothetical protein